MQADRDLSPGEVIISEDSYAAVLNPNFLTTHCSYCFKKSLFSILPYIQMMIFMDIIILTLFYIGAFFAHSRVTAALNACREHGSSIIGWSVNLPAVGGRYLVACTCMHHTCTVLTEYV